MNFSRRTNYALILLLLILNIVLRLQVVRQEIGIDSFMMHMMINSLTEYGYAKWVLHPLSLAGLYPYSYASSVLFLISGIQQTTSLEMNDVIFIYTILLSFLSVFTMYLMTSSFINDDFFKFISVFIFSTSPSIVSYTTYTIGTRPVVVILAPLLFYLILSLKTSTRQVALILIFVSFLFVTHHLFYFLIPIVIISIILNVLSHTHMSHLTIRKVLGQYSHIMYLLIPLLVFFVSLSFPFVFNKFLYDTGSKYNIIVPILNYVRYTGPSIIYSVGGIVYLLFKQKKSVWEWLLLLSILILTAFIYIPTYMKWLIPIFLTPLAGMGVINFLKSQKVKYVSTLLIVILVINIIFTGYYQFLGHQEQSYHEREQRYYERYIEESTYDTGMWIKQFAHGKAISNDRIISFRISAVSDTTHFLVPYTPIVAIYGFTDTNLSLFQRYPLSSEEFWFNGYNGPDIGEKLWSDIHNTFPIYSNEFEIKYLVEEVEGNGNVVWNHRSFPSKIVEIAQKDNRIYDIGNIRIWDVSVI